MDEFREIILGQKETFVNNLRTLGIVGAGRSGLSLVHLAKKLAKDVRITDINKDIPEENIAVFNNLGVEFELGKHSQGFLKAVDLIVVSPGVDAEWLKSKYLSGLDIPIVGEIEFSYWFCKSKNIIAITGTNGKTTTTFVIGDILKKHTGRKVHVLGNIGSPFSSAVVDIQADDYIVLEISSFQLETVFSFKPHVACLLNFSPDHLDRYPNLNSYFQAKKRIFMNQEGSDYAIIPRALEADLGSLKAQKILVDDDNISFIRKALGIYNLKEGFVDAYMDNFKGLSHRLELVARKGNITFINDSKATNVSATNFALSKIKGPIILIAGGMDKGLDYSQVKPFLGDVKKIFLIGQTKAKIKQDLGDCVATEELSCLEEAVISAYRQAEQGDTVLLSPMCSSFDMFKDYKDRGNRFREAVNKLP
ncbi:MAG: hypothetical protein JW734_08100 [Candidatus Omnitrophica bacterium]|nr:hypothetical protein [Candidatus Omnitrophota bacterium]